MVTALSAWLASVTIAAPIVSIFSAIAFYVATDGNTDAAVAGFAAGLAGALIYGATFVWLGAVTKRATIAALAYLFLWEFMLMNGLWFGGFSFSQFSITHVVRSVAARFVDDTDLATTLGFSWTSIAIMAVLFIAGFLFLTGRRLDRIEVA